MAIPKSAKKKSVLKTEKEIKMADLSGGDIKQMANNRGFREYLSNKGMNVDKIPTKEIMLEEYMKYLNSTGQ